MEEKPIRIIVDYNNQRFTFTMPQIAEVAMWSEAIADKGTKVAPSKIITSINIEASYDGGIDVKKEEIPD